MLRVAQEDMKQRTGKRCPHRSPAGIPEVGDDTLFESRPYLLVSEISLDRMNLS